MSVIGVIWEGQTANSLEMKAKKDFPINHRDRRNSLPNCTMFSSLSILFLLRACFFHDYNKYVFFFIPVVLRQW